MIFADFPIFSNFSYIWAVALWWLYFGVSFSSIFMKFDPWLLVALGGSWWLYLGFIKIQQNFLYFHEF
jgi:hypothetical protein